MVVTGFCLACACDGHPKEKRKCLRKFLGKEMSCGMSEGKKHSGSYDKFRSSVCTAVDGVCSYLPPSPQFGSPVSFQVVGAYSSFVYEVNIDS